MTGGTLDIVGILGWIDDGLQWYYKNKLNIWVTAGAECGGNKVKWSLQFIAS